MVSSTITLVAITAIFTGILLAGENEKLPPYEEIKASYLNLDKGGYDLEELEAPLLTGIPLQILGWMMRTPVLRRIITKFLCKDNRMINVRRLASYLPDMPLFYPFVEPQQTMVPPPTPLNLTLFTQQSQNDTPTTKKSTPFRYATIHDYTSRYASNQITPLQVAQAVLAALDHSQKLKHPLNIMFERHDEEVLAQARASTARYAVNKPLGVLDGVPVVVKDELLVEHHTVFLGTTFLGRDQSAASKDDQPILRLRAAGAIIIGTTNMHEIGLGVTGYNKHYGVARNPHNPLHYTGGSSSGSAVAVATGIVPLAVGVDGGGSIRIPASLCGVVGIKPTFQRIPPLAADCPTVAVIGPIAGTVRDAAIGYAVMSGSHASSFPRGIAMPPIDLHSFDQITSLKGLKVGYFPAFTNDSSPIIAQAVDKVAHQLQQLGAELIEIKLDHLQAIHLAHSISISTEMAQNLDQYYSFIHEMSSETQILLSMAREYSPLDYLAAQRVRAFALRQLETEVFSKVDIWIAPSTGITAPKIPTAAVKGGELNSQQITKIFRFSLYANFVGNPGVAVPVGYDEQGLPLSVQLQASHWNEDTMLRVAHAIERLYTTKQHQPSVYYSILEDASKYQKGSERI